MPDRRVVVFLSHADASSLRLAGSCALAAAALGDRVDVYLFGPAVPAVVAAAGEGDPDDPASLHAEQARGAGCRLVACSARVVEQKVSLDDAGRALDAVVGWPTILEWSSGVVDRYFF